MASGSAATDSTTVLMLAQRRGALPLALRAGRPHVWPGTRRRFGYDLRPADARAASVAPVCLPGGEAPRSSGRRQYLGGAEVGAPASVTLMCTVWSSSSPISLSQS